MPLPNMTPQQFLDAATDVAARFPDAKLVKNQVGNLAIANNDIYVGFVDLQYGTVVIFGDLV